MSKDSPSSQLCCIYSNETCIFIQRPTTVHFGCVMTNHLVFEFSQVIRDSVAGMTNGGLTIRTRFLESHRKIKEKNNNEKVEESVFT